MKKSKKLLNFYYFRHYFQLKYHLLLLKIHLLFNFLTILDHCWHFWLLTKIIWRKTMPTDDMWPRILTWRKIMLLDNMWSEILTQKTMSMADMWLKVLLRKTMVIDIFTETLKILTTSNRHQNDIVTISNWHRNDYDVDSILLRYWFNNIKTRSKWDQNNVDMRSLRCWNDIKMIL